MPIVSGAQTRSTAPRNAVDRWTPTDGLSSTNGFGYAGTGPHPLVALGGGPVYDLLYERQLWPAVAVNKLTSLQLQLPAKVYRRRRRGREDARSSPFGQLMARPSTVLNPVLFWTWFTAMYHIHGRSYALKGRDAGGRPVELALIHPTRMRYGPPSGTAGPARWWFRRKDGTEFEVDRSSFICWSRFSPGEPLAGMSPMEPLRDTLEMEAAARLANKSLMQRGGKHDIVLKTPKNFGNGTSNVLIRLADQYQARHGGVANWGRPLILEDGMEPMPLSMAPKDMEYIEARRLNREEVAAAFDIPPPAIGILDRATFSNVTEQNRMLYRTTMPPHLQSFEAMIDFDLRDGRFGENREPDFGDAFYFEWLVDGVLRGSTEERIAANAQGIQTGQLTPAEAREFENRPFIPGSDRLFVNSAMVTIDAASASAPAVGSGVAPAAALPQSAGPGGGSAAGPGPRPPDAVFALMGRLGRVATLDQLDHRFTAGLADDVAEVVAGWVAEAETVADLKDMIRNGAR
jgi:HK97 family phage portal protein